MKEKNRGMNECEWKEERQWWDGEIYLVLRILLLFLSKSGNVWVNLM